MRYLIDTGLLPTIARLTKEGVSGDLLTDLAHSPITWTSISTGKHRYKHGVDNVRTSFSYTQEAILVPQLWEIATAQGVDAIVANWFFRPSAAYAGEKGDETETISPLTKLLRQRHSGLIAAIDFNIDDAQHCAGWEIEEMLAREPRADLPLLRKEHPFLDSVISRYQIFDSRLASLVAELREEDVLLVVSDHGVGGIAAQEKKAGFSPKLAELLGLSFEKLFHTGDELGGVRKLIASVAGRPIELSITFHTPESFDQTQSQYLGKNGPLVYARLSEFSLTFEPAPNTPNSAAERDLAKVAHLLLSLREESKQVFVLSEQQAPLRRVFRLAPQLLQTLWTAPCGFEGKYVAVSAHSGTHDNFHPGWFLMRGPNIARGRTVNAVHVYDITPLALVNLGLPVAKDMDGEIIPELFVKAPAIAFVQTYAKPSQAGTSPKQRNLSNQELQRLRSLGYLE